MASAFLRLSVSVAPDRAILNRIVYGYMDGVLLIAQLRYHYGAGD